MIDTVSEIELVRFAAILIGALVSVYAVCDAWCDWRALVYTGRNGVLRLVVKRNFRAEAFRLLVQLIQLGPMALALFMPSSQSMMSLPPGLVGALWIPTNTWASTTTSVILLVWTLWAIYDRRLLVRMLERKG
jgi:hypothetical protein